MWDGRESTELPRPEGLSAGLAQNLWEKGLLTTEVLLKFLFYYRANPLS